jgi:hypothetical protein
MSKSQNVQKVNFLNTAFLAVCQRHRHRSAPDCTSRHRTAPVGTGRHWSAPDATGRHRHRQAPGTTGTGTDRPRPDWTGTRPLPPSRVVLLRI